MFPLFRPSSEGEADERGADEVFDGVHDEASAVEEDEVADARERAEGVSRRADGDEPGDVHASGRERSGSGEARSDDGDLHVGVFERGAAEELGARSVEVGEDFGRGRHWEFGVES